MVSENRRTNSMMDWNIRPSSDSSLQAKNIEFQGAHLEQRFPAASSSSALQPILPSLSNANKGFGPSKHLQNMPPVSLSGSAVFVQMTSSAIQNSNMMRNVHPSSCVVLQDGTVNPVQNIPQKRANPYMAMENYNNQPQQINSNSVRMPVYQQGCKNSQTPKSQPTLTPYIYVNGPSVSQVGATGPLNFSSSHYLNSQQNFSYTILPIGQNIQNQINVQNPSMAATVQSQQYASNVNNVPYNMPTHCDKRNAIQISSYTVPIQVTNKPPPAYRGPPVQTNNGQFSLLQSGANISNENVQNYHRPMPDLNTASYSAHCVQKGQSTRETNGVGGIAYNGSERGSGNQLSNESTKSSVEFRDSLLSSVQLGRIISADEALTWQTGQTFEPQKKPGNVPVNFSDNPLNVKITKESLARDYKKFKAMKHVLLKLGEAYTRKREIFLSTQENKQASDPSDHNQNLNQSSHSITQNEPSPVADPALQFTSQDANKNQSSSPASYDSNQNNAVPLLPQKTGSHLLPILRNLLEGTDDENMPFDAFFEKEVTLQNGQLAVDGSSSRKLSVTSGDKSKYSVNNTASSSRLSPQISQMDPTQEPLPCKKHDMSLMKTSSSTSHQLEKVNATSGTGSLHFKLNRDALETLREYISCRLDKLVQSSEKEITENIHDSQSVCPISVQKHDKNIRTGDEHVYDASSSASLHSKRVAVMQEADNVQDPTVAADSFRNGGLCSLEELKTSLDLWRKSLPTSLNGQLHESTQSTGSLSSSQGGENDKETQQSLENPTSTFAQNDQAKLTSGSHETTHSSVSISLEKNHDVVSSNLSKYSEPQVAIVTPLMLPKENIQIDLHKNSSSLEITCPLSEEGRAHGLQKFLSTVPQNDKEIQGTMCSPSESVNYCENIHVHQKAVLPKQENGKVNVEPGKNYCHGLIQKAVSHSPLKSQLGSGDNLPPDKTVSQKYVQSQTGPDLAESRETDEVVQNDAVLQISSVCTLVKGDAFYNSQIAHIFNTSPLTSSKENDTSSKDSIPFLQCNDQQSGILKTESEPASTEPELNLNVSEGNALLPSPCELSRAVEEIFKSIPDLEMSQSYNNSDEMNKRNSEEGGNSLRLPEKKLEGNLSCGVDSTDVMNGNQELCQNREDQFSSSTGDGLCVANKESAAECVSTEENQEPFGSSAETPVTLLHDQLDELSKEFPYGIGYLKTLNVKGNNDAIPKPNVTGNMENPILRKCHDPSGAIDQIKIMMLNSEQMKEVFPECKQQFLNKSENSEDDCFKTDSDSNLTRKNISPVTTDKAVAKETSSETTLKREVPTYCCAKAWIATGYVTGPCQCVLAKELGSKQEVDLCSQSQPSDNSNVDSKLNSQLPISTLDTVAKTQSDRTLIKISGPKTANEFEPYQVDQAVSRLPSFKKLNLQNPKQNNEHVRKEVSHHASSQPLKIEMEAVEISTKHDNLCARGNSSTDGAQSLSKTEDVAVFRNFCRNEQKTNKVDSFRHRRIEIKHSTNYERYKIKRDSSETQMIKGPTHKSLKRQKAIEKKRKALAIQHNDAISASNISNLGSFSQTGEKPQHISTSQSQEHLNGKKFVNIRDLEKHYGYKKVEHKERTYSALNEYQSEGTEHPSEHPKPIKRINLEKYAYSNDRKNAWKCRSSHLDNGKTRTPQKQRVRPPGISKMCSPGKEVMLDANKREKWSERSLSDKKSCFNRRTNKLSMFLQREPKKTYLNRVAFRRTAHKTIFLTNIEPSHSKSVWHVKSCSLSGLSKEKRKSSLPPQQPEAEKPPMLQFKMCPDILFRNPVTEEQISDARELPEKDRAPVTAVKSKREDWLNYTSVKRRKTEEDEAQVDDDIPLDTAIKLLDRNETFGISLKDSQTTFETYRKMHLEKRSRGLDSSPSN